MLLWKFFWLYSTAHQLWQRRWLLLGITWEMIGLFYTGVPGQVIWMPAPQAPLGCPPGLEYLTTIDQVVVQQQIELLEGKIVMFREFKQLLRWRQQERHKFPYLTMKSYSFARFARAFFIFGLSTKWNDLFCSCLDDVSTWCILTVQYLWSAGSN